MTIIIESFEIESPLYARRVRVDLAEGLDDSHFAFIEARWSPILKQRYNQALLHFFELSQPERTDERWREVLASMAIQDQHWKWRSKCAIPHGSHRRILSVLNGSEVEAAMVLRLGEESRDKTQKLPVVYIDFVAVAPWNRTTIQDPPRFRNLGTLMVGAAVEVSRSAGFEGRCGLHSLSQAEGFYRRIGMRDLGLDAEYDALRYFEFDAAGAAHFRGNHQ